MEIYNATGKTKSGELRESRAFGAILVTMNQSFDAVTSETVTVYIERADGNNTEIFTNLPLKAFLALSTAGNESIFEDVEGLTALCEICEEGSVSLKDTEAVKIRLDNLKPAVNYGLNGIEYPQNANSTVKITQKNLLSEETVRKLQVEDQELMIVENFQNIIEMQAGYVNGQTVKHTPEELKILSRDLDPAKLTRVGDNSAVLPDLPNMVTYSLVGVLWVEFKKQSGQPVTVYFKNDIVNY